MSDKYIRAIRRMALDGLLDARIAEKMLNARDAGRFVESEHPRGKGGKFVSKGSGTASKGGESNSSKEYNNGFAGKIAQEKASLAKTSPDMRDSLNKDPDGAQGQLEKMEAGTMIRLNSRGYETLTKNADGSFTYRNPFRTQPETVDAKRASEFIGAMKNEKGGPVKAVSEPKQGESGRDQYWDSVRACAQLEPNAGDNYTGKRVGVKEAISNGAKRASGELQFPKASGEEHKAYSTGNGVAVGDLSNGSGVTKINRDDIMNENPDDRVYNTMQEHCMETDDGQLVLTPEREKLHQDAIQELFNGAIKPAEGEPKVFTLMGGGSAAGKGTIQKSGVANLPDAKHSPVIDADELKKRIPEYTDTAFSEDHEKAASMAHEESSAMAKRAMQAAFANGYSCTLDGTGDGRLEGMQEKIDAARKA